MSAPAQESPKARLVTALQARFTPRSNARKALANCVEWLLTEEGQAFYEAAKAQRGRR